MKWHQSEQNNLVAAVISEAVVWYVTFDCPDITGSFYVGQEVAKIKITRKLITFISYSQKCVKLLTVDHYIKWPLEITVPGM